MQTLACIQDPVLSRVLVELYAKKSNNHPLAFLRTLLKSTDPNVTLTVLQCLRSLPVTAWAGVAIETQVNLLGETETLAPKADFPPSSPSAPATEPLDEFGPFQGTFEEPDLAGLSKPVPATQITMLPALFEEDEVGLIIGFLNSDDVTVRINVSHLISAWIEALVADSQQTLRTLFLADPSGSMIQQYLDSLLQPLSAPSPGQSPAYAQTLVCRSLEAGDILSATDGGKYSEFVTNILGAGATPQDDAISSPALSSRSISGHSGTKESAKTSRTGVLEGAVEMVLSKLRNGKIRKALLAWILKADALLLEASPAFQHAFTRRFLQTQSVDVQNETVTSTVLTICAAIACEYSPLEVDIGQQTLDAFTSLLPTSTGKPYICPFQPASHNPNSINPGNPPPCYA